MNNPKIIVAHPGRQHSFRVAQALKESGLLFKYATTVYNKDSSILMRLTKLFLSEDKLARAKKRKCKGLSDEDVIKYCEFWALLQLLVLRLDTTGIYQRKLSRWISCRFQKKLAKFIIHNNVDAVISYDTNSEVLIDELRRANSKCKIIIDNAHPNRHYLNRVYNEKLDKCGEFVKTLNGCGYILDEDHSKIFGRELRKADYHIVASSFSTKALEFEGISKDVVYKIPYGVDKDKFLDHKDSDDGLFRVLFVGEVNQRKGIHALLEAARKINDPKVKFIVVGGGGSVCADVYKPYDKYVDFLGMVSYETLLDNLASSDCFLFPTMGEGFGLVLLEAQAAGLPAITTRNCAGADIITEGVNGFLVDVEDEDAIIEKILYLKNNPIECARMRTASINLARQYTWDKYNLAIVTAVKEILSK